MKIAVDGLPDGVDALVEGGRATVSWGDPNAPTVASCECAGGELILFPARSYRHKDLMRRLGYVVADD